MQQADFTLNALVFVTYGGLQRRQGLLQAVDLLTAGVAQIMARRNQLAGTFELAGITLNQGGQLVFEADALVAGGLFLLVGQAEHGGEVVTTGLFQHAEQWQRFEVAAQLFEQLE